MSLLYFSEDLKKSVDEFAGSQKEKQVVTAELRQIIDNISKIGLPCYKWTSLCVLLSHCLRQSMQQLRTKLKVNSDKFEAREDDIISSLESYDAAPFTIQRLCELIVSPEVYFNYNKYINALDKMVNISSTINTLTAEQIQSINKLGRIPSTTEDNCFDFSESPSSTTPGENEESMSVDTSSSPSSSTNTATSSDSTRGGEEGGDVHSSDNNNGSSHNISEAEEVEDTEEIDNYYDEKATPMDI